MNVKIMMDPERYGYEQCPHCNGHGSSLRDPEGVNTCTRCGGSGLIRKQDAPPQKGA
jgi:DnaJ-class molecular chaperone